MKEDKALPPYLSYNTFKGFLDGLARNGVPSRIERGQVANMNGTNQQLTLAALRFLGLISPKNLSLKPLEQLAPSEGKERQKIWRGILENAYPKCFEIDLARTTDEELYEIFESQGVVSKDTARKCVTFFSHALKDAGIDLSPHVKAYRGVRVAKSRGRDLKPRLPKLTAVSGINHASRENDSGQMQAFLEKVPKLDPKWSLEEIDKWLYGVRGIKNIAAGANQEHNGITVSRGNEDKQQLLPFEVHPPEEEGDGQPATPR